MTNKQIYFSVLVAVILTTMFEFTLASPGTSSMLPPLLFWTSLPMGLIALSASIDLSEGKWFAKMSEKTSDFLPALLLPPFAFLIFSRNIGIYSWTKHPGAWLSPTFFIIRNFIFLLLPFLLGTVYLRAKKGKPEKLKLFAVLFLLSFVMSQSFLAFDLVMTLEYPWINTLFGGFFFVESLLLAVTLLSVIGVKLNRKFKGEFTGVVKDSAKMIMGFSLFWAGLFFSQYLVIWYGNLPEEVSFISKRVEIHSLKLLGTYALGALFVIPFLTYISKKAKTNRTVIYLVSFFIFTGYFTEKIFFVLPVTTIDPVSITIHTIIMGIPFILITRKICLKKD